MDSSFSVKANATPLGVLIYIELHSVHLEQCELQDPSDLIIDTLYQFDWTSIVRLLLGRHNTCLLNLDREATTKQSIDNTKFQLGEPVSFIGIADRNMREGLFVGAKMTQRQPHH